jgi:hypothetical protein
MGLSFGIAGASFAALLAFACLSDDLPEFLRYATWGFAVALPTSLAHAMLSFFVSQGGWSTKGTRILAFLTGQSSHLAVFAGIALTLFHISDIAAYLFAAVAVPTTIFFVFYARSYGSTCERLDERNHEGAPRIQPPLGKE